jgi:hypothetical protein
MGISGFFRESRDILGAYLGFLQNYSWQRLALKGGTLECGMLEHRTLERRNVECYFLPFFVIYQYFELICLV